MAVRVQINPNLRLDRDYTIVDLGEDVEGHLSGALFEEVQVYEVESGLVGVGWISEVNRHDGTVLVMVDWASLRIPESTTQVENLAETRAANRLLVLPDSDLFTPRETSSERLRVGKRNLSH